MQGTSEAKIDFRHERRCIGSQTAADAASCKPCMVPFIAKGIEMP
jgi:hypothetical protein